MMLFAAMLIAVALALCSWIAVPLGALALALVLPTYVVRFSVAGLPTTVLEFAVFGVFVGAVLHWLTRRSAFPHIPRAVWIAMMAWLAIGLFGVLVAADRYHALGLFRAYVLEPLLLVPLWATIASDQRWCKHFLHTVSALLIAIAGVAVLQRVHVLAGLQPWIAELPPRVTSIFEYPNALALFAAPLAAMLLGAALVLAAHARWERTLWIIGSFSGIGACVLANSRGALLALGVVVVVLGVWSKRRFLWWTCCALVVIALVVVPSTRQNISSIIRLRDTSTDVRHVLWEGTWRLIRARPMTGAGLGGFPQVYSHYRLPQHVELLEYPHNILLNVWVAFGLPGAVATVVFVFWLGYACFRRLQRHDVWVVPVMAAWIVLLVHGLVDVPYFKNDLAILTVALAAFVLWSPMAHPAAQSKIPPA